MGNFSEVGESDKVTLRNVGIPDYTVTFIVGQVDVYQGSGDRSIGPRPGFPLYADINWDIVEHEKGAGIEPGLGSVVIITSVKNSDKELIIHHMSPGRWLVVASHGMVTTAGQRMTWPEVKTFDDESIWNFDLIVVEAENG